MNDLEKQEITNRAKAMNEQEQALVLKMISSDLMWDELRRRDNINRNMIASCREVMKISE